MTRPTRVCFGPIIVIFIRSSVANMPRGTEAVALGQTVEAAYSRLSVSPLVGCIIPRPTSVGTSESILGIEMLVGPCLAKGLAASRELRSNSINKRRLKRSSTREVGSVCRFCG